MDKVLNKNDIVYYAKIFPKMGIYELYELKIRTLTDKYFVATDDKTKQAHLFGLDSVGECIFTDRNEALEVVHEAEMHKPKVSDETFYEEY